MSDGQTFRRIDQYWQAEWERRQAFRAANPGEPGAERPKYYVLDFFPYPSGAGLHVGHPLGYIATDILARYKRMRGFNVLHPMGYDAFGLPAEQYALETGIHPRVTTQNNIATYERQLRMIGLSYDWSRQFATTDVAYYRWTQWIFLKIYHSWYDPEWRWQDRAGRERRGKARPIDELPIPKEVRGQGPRAVEQYQADHRLAYLSEAPVNWCPALGTVLSNEEVTAEGRSERGNHPVYRRPMKQWMLRITEYADRLLQGLELLDWPEPIKLQQRNWIGRSEGAYVDFRIETGQAAGQVLRVFTTRPDTLYGATYMVLAPEHRLVSAVTSPEHTEAVQAYVAQARQKSDQERSAGDRRKTGVFTGGYALNPANHRRIPIWVADYVLAGYGTGSIMSVPGHDHRDLEFAETYGLEVVRVVEPPPGVDWRGYEGDGVACDSPPEHERHDSAEGERFADQCDLNGLPTPQAKRRMIEWLEQRDLGEGTVQYKLRDWLFSRQRYWGEPFPVAYREDGGIVALEPHELPVTLPDLADFRPHASDDPQAEPQTPLARVADWVHFTRAGERLRREVNTMPNWAGSCWYYLRFCDPANEQAPIGPEAERYWSGLAASAGSPAGGSAAEPVGLVDLYLGGAEHAVLHLLYARFWHAVLYDLGLVSTPEPFQKLFNQGMIQAYTYRDARGVVQSHDSVELRGEEAFSRATGEKLSVTVEKMSKSLKNVVNPDAIIEEFGADTLRLYEMYMGPLEASKPWNTRDIVGVYRFLQRAWRLVVGDESAERADEPAGASVGSAALNPKLSVADDPALERLLHKTIRKVTRDIENFAFNTAIAQLIVWVNEATRAAQVGRGQVERFLRLLAPFAPHICEELRRRLGHAELIVDAPWPEWDEALTVDDEIEYAVQVNGKVRVRVMVASAADEEQISAVARAAAAADLAGKTPKRVVVVRGRLVNFII